MPLRGLVLCSGCGRVPVERGTRCARCQAARPRAPELTGKRTDLRPSAARRGYGRAWELLRAYVLDRDVFCRSPGCSRPAVEVDHILAKRFGGADDPANLQGLCKPHHSAKTLREVGL